MTAGLAASEKVPSFRSCSAKMSNQSNLKQYMANKAVQPQHQRNCNNWAALCTKTLFVNRTIFAMLHLPRDVLSIHLWDWYVRGVCQLHPNHQRGCEDRTHADGAARRALPENRIRSRTHCRWAPSCAAQIARLVIRSHCMSRFQNGTHHPQVLFVEL